MLLNSNQQTTETNSQQTTETNGQQTTETNSQQTTTTAPSWDGIIDANGALAQNWRDVLPEDIRADKSLDSVKTFQTLAKSYVNAQHAIGRGRLAIPTDAATDAEWDEVYDKLGRPASADGYTSENLKQMPDGPIKDGVKEAFYKAGLSDRQASKMLDLYSQMGRQEIAEREEYRRQSENELRAEWGRNYDANLAKAKAAAEELGILDALSGTDALNNPAFIRIMHKLGEDRSESTLIGGRGNTGGDIQSRIREITGNPQDPYFDANHPNHAARVSEVSRLLKLQAQYRG